MNWFNYYGLAIMVIIMIPNILYAVKHKNDNADSYKNKTVYAIEQVCRYGCFALMIFNIPFTWIGFWFSFGEIVYLTVNAVLLVAYLLSWIILRKQNGTLKALLLSVIPSAIFIFSGIMIVSVPLLAFSVGFCITHVLISVKNAK